MTLKKSFQQGRRRRMDKFDLSEISAVDRPAQGLALASIEKAQGTVMDYETSVDDGRMTDDEWDAIKGATIRSPMPGETRGEFIASLAAEPIAKAVSPEALVAVAHARFEASLADEFEGPMPGETAESFASRAGVEKADAALAMKTYTDPDLMEKRGDMVDLLSEVADQHQHGISIYEYPEGMSVVVHFASAEMGEMHDHQIVFADGVYRMSTNRGHTHALDNEKLQAALLSRLAKTAEELTKHAEARQERARLARTGIAQTDGSFPIRNEADFALAVVAMEKAEGEVSPDLVDHLRKRAKELSLSLPETGVLAAPIDPASPSGGSVGKGAKPMSDNKELDALKAQNDRLTAIVGLSAVHKAHFDTLDEDGQNAFLKADADARDDLVTKAEAAKAESDPVVYKSLDGEEFRKSDDERLVRMAKRSDEREKENIRLQKAAEDESLTKRAETDLGNFPGEVATRKAILKAVDGIEDETVRGEALTALKAKNAKLGKGFTTIGTSASPATVEKAADQSEAETQLDDLAKARAEKDGISFLDAYEKVSDENPELLAKAIAG